MESPHYVLKTSNAKRFVVEDSITKVTSDGEPHEMMTMIAGLSGLLAAVVILTVLIFLVACKKTTKKHECDKCTESGCPSGSPTDALEIGSKCSSIYSVYNPKQLQGRSISVLYGRDDNMSCCSSKSNLNKAFESSELDLNRYLERPKEKKKAHWQDEMEMRKETSIEIERC